MEFKNKLPMSQVSTLRHHHTFSLEATLHNKNKYHHKYSSNSITLIVASTLEKEAKIKRK